MKPSQSALDFLKRKKLQPAFDYRDVWQEEHSVAFTVAKAMRQDVLEDIYAAVVSAQAEGKTLRQFQKELTPILQQKGWWGLQQVTDPLTGQTKAAQLGSPRRLKIIYNTNMRTSRAAGQWGRIERNKKTHPYLVYELGPSKEHRLEHEQWEGLILPVDDPWWDVHYPPSAWGCKCRVRAITQREYDRLKGGGKHFTQAPPDEFKDWVNKRTGEIEQVAKGVHPAFNYHIGKHRLIETQSIIRKKVNATQSDLALGTVSSLVSSQVFSRWYQEPKAQSSFVIGALDNDLKARLKTSQKAVLISDETLAKQKRNHPELTLEEYQLIPEIIRNGETIQTKGSNISIYSVNGKLYRVVVKTTRGKDENYLTSFHRAEQRNLNKDRAQGKVIRQHR